MSRLLLAEAVSRYGAIISGTWADEAKWCILYQVPDTIASTWINSITGCPTKHIYCNKEIVGPLNQALAMVEAQGLLSQLRTFDGCFMVRDVRGLPGKPSTHSYGCAIDINAATNQLGSDGDNSEQLAKCFTDSGFSWGLRFPRKDPMHFSCAWE